MHTLVTLGTIKEAGKKTTDLLFPNTIKTITQTSDPAVVSYQSYGCRIIAVLVGRYNCK